MSTHVLKQLYYTLIYPYLNYAVVVWGKAYPSNLNKINCALFKRNAFDKINMFFANCRKSSQVFYKLLDILKFDNIVKLSTCILAHKIFNKSSNIFLDRFMILLEQSLACTSITPDTPQPKVRTNTGKFTFINYVASKL